MKTITNLLLSSLLLLAGACGQTQKNTECPQPASYEIAVCNVADDAAIVSIDSQFGETKFADMFTLVKDGADWKIISKIYHVK